MFTVLLVEDDDLDAEMVNRAFKKSDVPVRLERAVDGKSALSMLHNELSIAKEHPLIVFLDLNMPGVNGHEFLERLRNDDTLRSTTVFVLTTSSHARDVERAYEKNVAGYFTKPQLSHLIGVLKSYSQGAELPKLK
ncbi:Response regulator rcp1 [Rubripirellula amarantea]|uniref:Response regulator rcp1 n=1 Tax=Rubripirellula amarantea TaxID=2527999 RepID=A0A5C5WJA3_9BACT|nr:response regulator [Rubripirellula amarantea]TWT50229.1 Response regulator rcp1 [Rubripirellula amarantea]